MHTQAMLDRLRGIQLTMPAITQQHLAQVCYGIPLYQAAVHTGRWLQNGTSVCTSVSGLLHVMTIAPDCNAGAQWKSWVS